MLNNLSTIPTDPVMTRKMAKMVLDMNNMQIVNRFSPVVSEYKFQIAPNIRHIFTLTEDEFIAKEQRFRYGKWCDSVEMRTFGPLEKLEEDLMICIENLNNLIAHHPKVYKRIKPF